MAQKEYIIKLAEPKETVDLFMDNLTRAKINKRHVEVAAIDTMIGIASISKKSPSDFQLCASLQAQVKGITDKEDCLVVTEWDYNLIMDGFKKSAEGDKRPVWFASLYELFSQLNKPTLKEQKPIQGKKKE